MLAAGICGGSLRDGDGVVGICAVDANVRQVDELAHSRDAGRPEPKLRVGAELFRVWPVVIAPHVDQRIDSLQLQHVRDVGDRKLVPLQEHIPSLLLHEVWNVGHGEDAAHPILGQTVGGDAFHGPAQRAFRNRYQPTVGAFPLQVQQHLRPEAGCCSDHANGVLKLA